MTRHAPAERHHRRRARAGRRRAVRDAPARRSRRARDQDRAPRGGDFARGYDATVNGLSSYFVWLNRSKESLTLDLKQPEAADSPGAPARARRRLRAESRARRRRSGSALGTADLRARYPRLIVCDVSGYGSSGPYAHEEGLRPARAERSRARCRSPARETRRQGRHLGRRHRRRHVCVSRAFSRRSSRAGDDRRGRGGRRLALRCAGRMDGRAGLLHRLRRHARRRAPAPTTRPSRPTGRSRRDGREVVSGDPERARVGRASAPTCSAGPTLGDRSSASRTNARRVRHRRGAARRDRRRLPHAGGGRDPRAARGGADRERADEHGRASFSIIRSSPSATRWRDIDSPAGPTARARSADAHLSGVEPVMGPVPALGEHSEAILSELGFDAATIARWRTRGVI